MSIHNNERDDDNERDDEHIDGCLCGVDLDDDTEVTSDEELPESQGGVVIATMDADPQAETKDGCDLDFSADEITADDDLPVSFGGVG